METTKKTLSIATVYTFKCASSSSASVTCTTYNDDGTTRDTWTLAPGESRAWHCDCAEITITSAGDPTYSIVPFNRAAPVHVNGGGLNETRVKEIAGEVVEEALIEEVSRTQSTPEGAGDIVFFWCELSEVVPAGKIKEISIPCRTSQGNITTEPRYLGVWEDDGSGNFACLGASVNAVSQTVGGVSHWQFDDLHLTGRNIRLCLLPERNSPWQENAQRFGARSNPAWNDCYVVTPTGRLAQLIGLSFVAADPVPRVAPASHVADAVVHVTSVERARWDGKADASALSGKLNTATFNAHANDTSKHVTNADRAQWSGDVDAARIKDSRGQAVLEETPDYVDGNNTYPGSLNLKMTGHPATGKPTITLEDGFGTGKLNADVLQLQRQGYSFRLKLEGNATDGVHCIMSHGSTSCDVVEMMTHPSDTAAHITQQERATWNGKADASALSGKLNTATFNAHANDTSKHVTDADRASLAELLARKDEILALLSPSN